MLVIFGWTWDAMGYDYHFRGHLGQPGFQIQMIQAAATYLQSWGERARAVAVLWLVLRCYISP
jgi:hypothetical protein